MKRFMTLLCALLVLALPCFAQESLFVYDPGDQLTSEEFSELTDQIETVSSAVGIDYVFCIADDVGEQTLSDYAYDYYKNSECSPDALLLILDTEQMTVNAFAYGEAGTYYDEATVDDLLDQFVDDYSAQGLKQALVNFLINAVSETQAAPVEMPFWYPEDVHAFEDFHAENAPLIADDADLFTSEEEAALEAQIRSIRETVGHDLVLYTDVTSYGLPRNVCAADFYQFNGYGFGDNYSGSVLFICMEEGNRGWYTAVRGESQNILTYEELNRVDDRLEPYMKSGEYFKGVTGYLSDIQTVYQTGHAPRPFPVEKLLISLAAGLAAAAITLAVLRSKMKVVHEAVYATNYLVDGSFHLRKSYDIFLFRNVSRVKREKRSGGSSGGSFSSSSGASFSGSGRSF